MPEGQAQPDPQRSFIEKFIGGNIMVDYEKLYKFLFNGITDALKSMENNNYITAEVGLIRLQQKAEDLYIQAGIGHPDS